MRGYLLKLTSVVISGHHGLPGLVFIYCHRFSPEIWPRQYRDDDLTVQNHRYSLPDCVLKHQSTSPTRSEVPYLNETSADMLQLVCCITMPEELY